MSYTVKQVIILRKDLNMRKGKMVAQGAHASMAVLLNAGEVSDRDDSWFEISMNDDMKQWLTTSFAKICVSVNSEEELHNLYRQATKAGLPASIIKDAGFTEFNGVPTYTAVAIGPAKAVEIDLITGDLKLL